MSKQRKLWMQAMEHYAHRDLFLSVIDEMERQVTEEHLPIYYVSLASGVSTGTLNRWMNYMTFQPHLRTVCSVAEGLGMKIEARLDED